VKVIADGKTIGEGKGGGEIVLEGVQEGNVEVMVVIGTEGEVRLETVQFIH
jgi:hypothetical protein